MKAQTIVLSALLLVPVAASAQFSTQAFQPAMGPRNWLTSHGSRIEGHLNWSAGALGSFERNPFEIEIAECRRTIEAGRCPQDDYEIVGERSVVRNQFVMHLMGTLSLKRRLQVGLDLPLAYVSGNVLDDETARVTERFTGMGLSDPRLEGKYRILGGARGLGVAAALTITIPIADLAGQDSDRHLGSGVPTFVPRAIVDYRRKKLEVGANLFVDVRYDATPAFSSTVGTSLGWSFAGSWQFTPKIRGMLELFGSSAPPFEEDVSPAEIDLAGQYLLRNIHLTAGGGVGITGGIGAPDFRVFVGGLFYPYVGDRDHDGIDDRADDCKDEEEDEDGFQDSDGCPEADNDADGMDDADDRCANEPEDMDEYQDTDGCPEPDNDGDGITDGYDSCVNSAEDPDGDRDEDGCPDNDADGDGVNDMNDRCANEAEDTDGNADEDGCPDPDDDGDGVPDAEDQCGDQAEDRDGDRDDDGCPDEGPAPRRRRGGGN